jgi:drug/metabolite transporter (DMT)-like permease
LAGLLYAGAALAVVPSCLRSPPELAQLWAERTRLAVAVVAGGIIGPVLLVAGLSRTDAATASLLLNLELVATILLAATLFREHLGGRVLAGAILVTVAAAALTWRDGAQPAPGALLIAAACLCWGVDNSSTARIEHIAPAHITLVKGVVAGSTNIVIGLLLGVGSTTGGDVVAAILIGTIGYGLSITLWVKGARDVGAARGQVVFATAPFLGAAVAWLVFGEPVMGIQLVALGLAAAGIVLTFDSAHEHRHLHEAMMHEHEHVHDVHHAHEHGSLAAVPERHTHRHTHRPMVHAHPHVPDLHHRHPHREH